MKIAIFCSANDKIDHEYFRLTAELGTWCAKNGHSIVFGGTDRGLMGCVSHFAFANGGQTIGVYPRLFEQQSKVSEYLSVHIPCDNLSERKELMTAKCDVAIALPGGIGTLDEVFSMIASASLGYHHKPVILYNINGFWSSLIDMLNDLQAKGMLRGDYSQLLMTANSLSEIADIIARL